MSDYGDDAAYDTYDTDTISLTSTVDSEPEDSYVVECILSDEWDREDAIYKYLVKWYGYGWHRGTWEPAENLDGTTLLDEWSEKEQTKGMSAFIAIKRNNKARFEKSVREYSAAKQRRVQKRSKKKHKLRKQERRIVSSDDSEEDLPLILQWRNTQAKNQPLEPSKTKNESDIRSFDSLFVDSQEPQSPIERPPPLARRLPLDQSSSDDESSSSDTHSTADSLLEDLQEVDSETRAKTTKRNEADKKVRRGVPDLKARVPVKTVTARSNPTLDEENAQNSKTQREKNPAPHSTTSTTRKISGLAGNSVPKTGMSGGSKGIEQRTTTAAPRPSKSASMSTIKSSVAGPRPSGIKMINEPRTQLRKEWQHGDKQYSRLKYRGHAEKRSRVEGTPDIAALEFVNGPPVALVRSRAPASNESPYGRREVTKRRVLEADSDDEIPQRGHTDTAVSLEDWESNKIPLICPHWRLSSNCVYGRIKCRYLHRDKDLKGRDIKIAPADGLLQAKYRQPPLTCLFWLESERGCTKPDDQCDYAHTNTGWKQLSKGREPVKIDPNQVPVSMQNVHGNPQFNKDRRNLPPSQVTCWYWKHQQCHYTSETCQYQHTDTGIVANPPPRHTTCRDWAKGRCRNTAEGCRYRHADTDADPDQLLSELDPVNIVPLERRQPSHFAQMPAADSGSAIDFGMTDVAAPVLTDDLTSTTVPPPIERHLASIPCLQMKQKIEQICKLDFTDMFTGNRDEGAIVDRRAFLLYHPQDHVEELDLITRWLLMHHVEVGNAWYDGSWDHFKQQITGGGSGIIIAHPDFEYFSELPDLGQVLKSDVRMWSIGLQTVLEYCPAAFDSSPELRYDRIEIFPLGGFIYITDEVFEKQPQLALKIVELFFTKIRKLRQVAGPISPWHEVNDAAILWRLCVRPELMQHLLQICEKHEAELEAGNPDHTSRAKLYQLLCETNWIEQDDPIAPLSMVHDKYPILSERYNIAKEQPIDYFNTLSRSQNEANLRMIQYYVGLLIDMRRDYRQFYVVHTEPAAPHVQEWKKIHNIAEVMTPEQLIEELDKPSKKSKIDFYEWAMPAYKVKDQNEPPVGGVTA
ncbi:hypothetical protein P153DRAFT_431837 [Dothidotthia symphoricarpi CBS 119687]|uniref:Chromo domain-containing protein n=1 Tax=Dothidotthia symphoricarpi CBS 119687 TaxID=1392245 RepID=A0A6A6ACP8_9PLEO|nr:uncharacterized protein P153DRAFT_431837 [Dothidotthia symphoricarpi CBS 119687]KAF2129023.1 hypothetical protein P153DRAFT_431837 [Dothidotthia symphoricarpi CBS 119687]